ncbi:L-rhamnose mutarotase [Jejuia pallidilutea]|uniref:L-rhamnose mutarotase n=1 Tax=Jejuia pallidilutea TaxID=504487 RepID=A0A362XBB5_9FLAO|nr:L-rhamnose mutarotase [Jejuia pallidilutea]PQV51511.1 L-rhamnose mutarotase [Jejuia pallidilutea]
MRILSFLFLSIFLTSCNNQNNHKVASKSVDYVFTCNLVDSVGVKEKYAHYHSDEGIWPDVKQAAVESGANCLKVFAQGNRLVLIISLPENLSFDEFNDRYNNYSPKMAEWDSIMSGFQTAPPGADADQTWVPMETIYDYTR